MTTINQCTLNKARKPKKKWNKTPALRGNPQRKGICVKIYTRTPKKPNSALRKVSKLKLSSLRGKIKRVQVESYISGEGHSLQPFSAVLIRGGRVQDLPGVKYHGIRGKLDFKAEPNRKNARSKYGAKKSKKN